MFHKNAPHEVMVAVLRLDPESATSNWIHLCPIYFQAWQQDHQCHFENAPCQLYQVEDGFLIHVPGRTIPKEIYPFSNLFRSIPINKVSTGFLEMGEWLGDEYELDLQVSLCVGPDGKVWAEVGAVAELPQLPIKEREPLASQILDDFAEVFAAWVQEQEEKLLSLQTLPSWSIQQMMHWLQEIADDPEIRDAHPDMHLLMRGVIGELEILGFAGRSEAVEGSSIAMQTLG